MPTNPSLNQLQPENVPHGVDIVLQVVTPGGPIAVGEIYEMDYDEDNGMVKLPVLGSRITGERKGRFSVTGTIKAYWLNGTLRTMIAGGVPSASGTASPVYHSTFPLQRYQITATARNTTNVITFYNVTFGKDATRWTDNAFVEETITWSCEDVYGN